MGQDAEREACREEGGRKDRRRPGQRIRLPAAGHEPADTAAPSPAEPEPALGPLQEDDADQREDDQEMDDDEDGLHGWPERGTPARIDRLPLARPAWREEGGAIRRLWRGRSVPRRGL